MEGLSFLQLQIKFYHYLGIIKEYFYCWSTYKDILKIIKEKCNITSRYYHYHCAEYLLYHGLKKGPHSSLFYRMGWALAGQLREGTTEQRHYFTGQNEVLKLFQIDSTTECLLSF